MEYNCQASEDTENSISIEVNSETPGTSLRVNTEMEGEEEPSMEAEMWDEGRRKRDETTLHMETDSEDSSQDEGEARITFKRGS